ncbi:MAG TPA: CAP domain-containing protein [Actinomycetota bacterium]|nr:CAP domain-containing protein [Actinomycetota bacterium]
MVLGVTLLSGIAILVLLDRLAVDPRRLLGALLIVVVLAPPASALGRAERRALRAVNVVRIGHGLDPLRSSQRLSRYAERHARRMARAGEVFHSDLSFPKPPGWRCAGENVGMGGTIRSIHRRFMRSPSHRDNILNGCFERIGLGVVHARGVSWETQVFVG